MKLAVSGKGGVGKTTVAATLTRMLADSYKRVYAVDADPDACLAAAVGLGKEEIDRAKPLIDLKEVVEQKSAGRGAFFSLNPNVDDVLEEYSIHFNNIRFMRMGGIKQGGSACYCKENSFLNAVVGGLLWDKDSAVVMDMGAGIEHLSRGTARGVDCMLVVIEPSKNSVNTAKLVQQLSEDLGIFKIRFIANKIRNVKEEEFIAAHFNDKEILGFIPFDEEIWESSMNDGPACNVNTKLFSCMNDIYQKILQEVGPEI